MSKSWGHKTIILCFLLCDLLYFPFSFIS
uniref:Uncharacterized protein n=1 Tax=Rhizophora mucronata TaxID=61149 RepID=A0A2P2KVC3_RHIMU